MWTEKHVNVVKNSMEGFKKKKGWDTIIDLFVGWILGILTTIWLIAKV